jgi:CHASE1-domain containing sensor protein
MRAQHHSRHRLTQRRAQLLPRSQRLEGRLTKSTRAVLCEDKDSVSHNEFTVFSFQFSVSSVEYAEN